MLTRFIEDILKFTIYTAPIWLPLTLLWMAVDWVRNLPQPWPWVILAGLILIVVAIVAGGITASRERRTREAAAARQAAEAARRAAAHQAERDRYIQPVDHMSGTDFEHLVARLLATAGWHDAHVVGGANDFAADVIAHDEVGTRLVVQCKRYSTTRTVGSPHIQQVAGTHFGKHQADISAVITSTSFTPAATQFAHEENIYLVDREMLAAWMHTGRAPERLVPLRARSTPHVAPPTGHPVAATAEAVLPPPTGNPVVATLEDTSPGAGIRSETTPIGPGFKPDFISVVVSRTDVDAQSLDGPLGVLRSLVTSPDVLRQYCGRVDIRFHGYDDDPREIFEVPEIRRYVGMLDKALPQLPYLLSLYTSTLRALALCLVPAFRSDGGYVEVDFGQYDALATRWLGQAGRVARHTHDLEQRDALSASLESYLLQS